MKDTHLSNDSFSSGEFGMPENEFPVTKEVIPLPHEFGMTESEESTEAAPKASTMRRLQKMLAMLCAAGITVGSSLSLFSSPALYEPAPLTENSIPDDSSEAPVFTATAPSNDSSVPEDALIFEDSSAPEDSSEVIEEPLDLSPFAEAAASLHSSLSGGDLLSFFAYTYDPSVDLLSLADQFPDGELFALTDEGLYPYDKELIQGDVQMTFYLSETTDPDFSGETKVSFCARTLTQADNAWDSQVIYLFSSGGTTIVLRGNIDPTFSSDDAEYWELAGDPASFLPLHHVRGQLENGAFTGSVIDEYYTGWYTEADGPLETIPSAAAITYDLNEEGRIDISSLNLMSEDAFAMDAVSEGYRYQVKNGYLYVYALAEDNGNTMLVSHQYKLENGLTDVLFRTDVFDRLTP